MRDIGRAIAMRAAAAPLIRATAPSKQIEIFALLPFTNLGLEAGNLGLLDTDIVVDEGVAERGAETCARAQGVERLCERRRQELGLGLIGRVGAGARFILAVHAIEAGGDLRAH